MASRSVTPGGALLRASRVFAIPPALPRPVGELSSSLVFHSDTATLPHPIQQSITAPPSSRATGDWGLKRPLPLRATTKTTTPFIRVEAIDTLEHITEFASSADHVISLQKWHEMGVPLSTPLKKRIPGQFDKATSVSVFEESIDSTAPRSRGPADDGKWKFKGPWLAGKTEGDFVEYISREVRKRKNEFRQVLRIACAKSLSAEARKNATGDDVPDAVQASDITEEQLTEYIKVLRNERTELYKLIRDFLDLPPAPAPPMFDQVMDFLGGTESINFSSIPVSTSPYTETGPPKTHPSAGLAYSRTSAHIFNHPTFGPQQNSPPVKARVVMPRGAATNNFQPVLGAGGFVIEAPHSSEFNVNGPIKGAARSKSLLPGLLHIEPEKVGGSKAFVQPSHASVDPKGRVVLTVEVASEEAVAVLEGTTDQIPLPEQRRALGPRPMMKTLSFGGANSGGRNAKTSPSEGGYGLSRGGAEAPTAQKSPEKWDHPLGGGTI